MLRSLAQGPSYTRAVILNRLGRCAYLEGNLDQAVARIKHALRSIEQLKQNDTVRALYGLVLSDLGDACRATGRFTEARTAYDTAIRIAEDQRNLRGQGINFCQLGSLALAEGRPREAQERYHTALETIQQLNEPAMEALIWHQLGNAAREQGQLVEADDHYRRAASMREGQGDLAGAVQTWAQLATLNREVGKPATAEEWLRKAIKAEQTRANPTLLGRQLGNLADLLKDQPGRLQEARRLVEQAISNIHDFDPTASELWRNYGVLAKICDKEAELTTDLQKRSSLKSLGRAYRQLQRHAPEIVAALIRLGHSRNCGKALLLGRLGQCFQMGGRPELAAGLLQEALAIAKGVEPSDAATGLRATLQSKLGDAQQAIGQYADARMNHEAALKAAEELGDLRGQSEEIARLAALALAQDDLDEALAQNREALQLSREIGDPAIEAEIIDQTRRILQAQGCGDKIGQPGQVATRGSGARPDRSHHVHHDRGVVAGSMGASQEFEITVQEDQTTEYVFEPSLLIDGRRELRITRWSGELAVLPETARPLLLPCTQTTVNEWGAICFRLPLLEPVVERCPDCTIMRRIRREVAVHGSSGLLWRLLRAMDGARPVADILAQIDQGERASGARLLATLATIGVIDVSGRALGRFIHFTTRKGVLPAGGLQGAEVLELATDGGYRCYPGGSPITVSESVPERLVHFHALTRSRRSRRDYQSGTLDRTEIDAILHTACGVTGTLSHAGRSAALRSYPSSGALYAVEIYPVVFRVQGLKPAVYHYRPDHSMLEMVGSEIDPDRFASAALPMERDMVAAGAVMICLAGYFPRHERKYGEGGYRMMVAEAGHISQNLILAATALGLGARPFGGVFDTLINQDLGLDETQEQFLLAVLVGRTTSASDD
nr:tetratricopeptide repeat protein [Methylonatrum kenyense]